jgi:hypothetical protein
LILLVHRKQLWNVPMQILQNVSRPWLFAAIAFTTLNGAAPLAAQEYCVECMEPAALYRCQIDGARPGAATSLQALCLTALAKDGQHASCAIRRSVGVIDCNALIKRVAIPADGAPTVVAAPPADPKPQPTGEAKTVAEMLQRAKDKSDRDWEANTAKMKANNEKVGSFFKKSWDCLASVFSKCGSN